MVSTHGSYRAPGALFPPSSVKEEWRKANDLTQGRVVVAHPKIMMLHQPFSAKSELPTDSLFTPFSLLHPPEALLGLVPSNLLS